MIVIGIDPDSVAHGVAIYRGGKLAELARMNLVELVKMLAEIKDPVVMQIENVCANNFVYSRNNQASKAAQAKVGLSIGRCQQSQIELQRFLDAAQVPYVLHKPQKGNWAKDKPTFEKLTGWQGRSNEETRSAAFFGFLGVK